MDPRLAKIARAQGGMFSRAQALACAYSEQRIRTELRNRRWLVVVGGVYRLAGAPGGWNARVWATLLAAGPGAALGGRAAGRLHRIDGVPAYDHFEIVVPRERRPRRVPGAEVARTTLPRADVTRRGGIPVLAGARTVVDLARREPVDVAARIVADALRTGAVSPAALARQLDAARRCEGIVRAREAASLADPRLESVLEAELADLIRSTGIAVVPQYEVFHQGLFVARLDFAVEELRLGFEADGYGVHSLRPTFERDRERNALLHLADWLNVSFTAHQIRRRQAWVKEVVCRMEAQRRAELGKKSRTRQDT